MAIAPKKVFFHKPANWTSMAQEEKDAFVDSLLDQMGWPTEEVDSTGAVSVPDTKTQPSAKG